MAEKLTNEQQAAVDSRERSLLVSAAAGSGKTKVLVERLFSYVEREGANLDDFLIITYTRAAASELRGKIAARIAEALASTPNDRHLQRAHGARPRQLPPAAADAACLPCGHQDGGRVLHRAFARKLPSARRGRARARAAARFPRAGRERGAGAARARARAHAGRFLRLSDARRHTAGRHAWRGARRQRA